VIGNVDNKSRALLGIPIANDGEHPLLGTGLLDRRILHIDYAAQKLSLD